VKLIAAEDVLTVLATDLEAGCRFQVTTVQVEEPGEALVPAARLAGIVRESADEESLSLQTDKDACVVRGAGSRFRILGYDPAEYPAVAEFEEPADFQVPAATLGEMIARTLFATAKTHSHYAMAGVLWEASGKKLSLVATDGHRLAQARGPLKAAAAKDIKAIAPTKLMGLIQRLAGDGDTEEMIEVKVQENQILLRSARATLMSTLVQGNFPRYEDVIPSDCAMKATIDTQQFGHRIRQVALLADEESRTIRLNFQGEQVTLSARAPEAGEAESTCPIRYEGQPLEIGFTPSFLTDALRVVDADEVSLEMNANNKPAVLKAGGDFVYVIMPIDLG
jgi:DNA polymerase-3 subunit beta